MKGAVTVVADGVGDDAVDIAGAVGEDDDGRPGDREGEPLLGSHDNAVMTSDKLAVRFMSSS